MFPYILKYIVYVLGVLLSTSVDNLNNIQIKLKECNGKVAKLILYKFNKVVWKNNYNRLIRLNDN